MRNGITRMDTDSRAKATTNRSIITTTITTLFNNIPLANAASGKGGVVFHERGRKLIAAQWLLMCVVNVVGGINSYLFLVANDIIKNRQYFLEVGRIGHAQAVEAIGDGVVQMFQRVHGELVVMNAFLRNEAVHVEGAREGGTMGLIAN